MSKFDFFDEGVRKVFENFELPTEENAWTNFEAYLSGGAKAFSFLKSLILPGILSTGILATIHVASENHIQNNELSHQSQYNQTHISSQKTFDQHTDLTQNQTNVDRHDQFISSENSESTTMNISDSENSYTLNGTDADNPNSGITELSDSGSMSENISKTSSNTTSNVVSNSSNSEKRNNSDSKSEVENNETQNSNTIKFVGRAFRLDAPAKFTPNHDGINDTFMPPALGKTANFQLFVYNSDGDLVFMSDNVENAWDGKFMGTDDDAPEGHYDWRVELSVDQDLHQYAGKVQLFR